MPDPITLLLLQGDAESRLLADAEVALQVVFAGNEVRLDRAWMNRPEWLTEAQPALPDGYAAGGLPPDGARALLGQRYQLVLLSPLALISMPGLRHRGGGAFLAHRALRAGWPPEAAAVVAADCTELPPMAPRAAIAALEPLVQQLLVAGTAVVVCNAFRHVIEPLQWRAMTGERTLRERIRELNLEVARLSQRTGCFVLDLDRPLAQEGGATLQADCFGGGERAAELALDEFAAVVLDALPDAFMPMEPT